MEGYRLGRERASPSGVGHSPSPTPFYPHLCTLQQGEQKNLTLKRSCQHPGGTKTDISVPHTSPLLSPNSICQSDNDSICLAWCWQTAQSLVNPGVFEVAGYPGQSVPRDAKGRPVSRCWHSYISTQMRSCLQNSFTPFLLVAFPFVLNLSFRNQNSLLHFSDSFL